jgi:hypothetical protein
MQMQDPLLSRLDLEGSMGIQVSNIFGQRNLPLARPTRHDIIITAALIKGRCCVKEGELIQY